MKKEPERAPSFKSFIETITGGARNKVLVLNDLESSKIHIMQQSPTRIEISKIMVPNFLIARFTVSFCRFKSTHFHLVSLLQHDPSPLFFNSFTSHTSSDGNHDKVDTFTKSYLIDSCGLSPDSATKLSNGNLVLKTPDGPNAVLELLKNYGFSKTQIAKLVQMNPSVLSANAKKTLLPKLEFLSSIRVSNSDIPKILIRNSVILFLSVKKYLVPRYEVLRGVLRDDQEVVRALRHCPRCFTYCDIMNDLVPNIEVLKQCGVPQSSISLLITNYPGTAYVKHSKFVEVVKLVKEIEFEPMKTSFVMAIHVLYSNNKAVWESKFEVYKKWGWSREMTLQAFRRFPNFMKLSDDNVTKKLTFLVKDMGLSSEAIVKFPPVLTYNLEKRIIPRFSVIKILKSKGLVDNNLGFNIFMCITEEKFLKKYICNFHADLPLLQDVYKGLMDHRNVI